MLNMYSGNRVVHTIYVVPSYCYDGWLLYGYWYLNQLSRPTQLGDRSLGRNNWFLAMFLATGMEETILCNSRLVIVTADILI